MNVDARWPAQPSEDFYREAYAENYLLMQYHFVHLFTEHLADCSREFGGDLHSVLILALLGQRKLDSRIGRQFFGEGAAPPEIVPLEARGMNSASIAEISGVPRETVRRKLQALAERGWVERDAGGRWKIAFDGDVAAARRDLDGLQARQVDRVARFLARTHQVAAKYDADGAAAQATPPVEISAAATRRRVAERKARDTA